MQQLIITLMAVCGMMAPVAIGRLRRILITPRLLDLFKRILPAMSATERDALEAGTTWWDADLFTGKPKWSKLLAYGPPTLSAEERRFLDVEVNRLCELVNDWETQQAQDLTPQAWQYMKDKGFLGMIIPKKYGGKAFGAYMHSQVVMKLSTRCSALAVSVMVPNSLGPAELLLHYGTEAQKDYYLPRLASGAEIPCFALTSPYAGSDAAAIPDLGVVCMGMHEGRSTLGIRVSWTKRYITLAPVATLLGLAFQTSDPDHLLSSDASPGITCALIPATHDGVRIGRRHRPLNAAFQNGPTITHAVCSPPERRLVPASDSPHAAPAVQRTARPARRLPNSNAVERSAAGGTSAGPWSAFDCAIAPRKPARRLRSSGEPVAVWLPGSSPSPTQIMLCCIAKSANCWRVASLSPFKPAELVNPAASLFFHRCSLQRPDVASRNALNGADAPAM